MVRGPTYPRYRNAVAQNRSLSPVVGTPNPYGTVDRCAGNAGSIRAPGYPLALTALSGKSANLPSSRNIPDPHQPIPANPGELSTVGRPSKVCYVTARIAQHGKG